MELTQELMIKSLEQVMPELPPLKIGALEEKFIAALNNTEKLNKASLKEVSEALRYCMLKVGLRATNLPNELESAILYHHLVEHYGKLTVDEIRLAFDLAITQKIEAPDNYGNFSCAYLSKVLNAYKEWAEDVYQKNRTVIEKPERPPIEKLSGELNTWRESVQRAFESYLKGKAHYRLWPTEMYDQLVYDDFISALSYKDYMPEQRRLLCEQLQHKIVQVESILEQDVSKMALHKNLQNDLIEYRTGRRDKEVMLVAKQTVILRFFQYLKINDKTKIYIQ